MKIRDIKTYVLEAVLAEPFAYSQAWYERRGALLVEIVGEDGTSGLVTVDFEERSASPGTRSRR